jgi:hypothetical protein
MMTKSRFFGFDVIPACIALAAAFFGPAFFKADAGAQEAVSRTAPVSVQDPATGEWGVCSDPGDGTGARWVKGNYDLAKGKGRTESSARVVNGKHIAKADLSSRSGSAGGPRVDKTGMAPAQSSDQTTAPVDGSPPASPDILAAGVGPGGGPRVKGVSEASSSSSNLCDQAAGRLLLPAVQKNRD